MTLSSLAATEFDCQHDNKYEHQPFTINKRMAFFGLLITFQSWKLKKISWNRTSSHTVNQSVVWFQDDDH